MLVKHSLKDCKNFDYTRSVLLACCLWMQPLSSRSWYINSKFSKCSASRLRGWTAAGVRSLCSQRAVGKPEILNSQASLFNRRDFQLFPPGELGRDVVSTLVIFALCRTRPHWILQTSMFIADSLQTPENGFSVNGTHSIERDHRLNLGQTLLPRPLSRALFLRQ